MPGPVFRRVAGVALRPVERDDLPFLRRWWNRPEVRRWMPRSRPVDEASGEDALEGWVTDPTAPSFLVTPAHGNTRLGFVSLLDVAEDSGCATVAAWLKPDAQGEGHGTAALRSLVGYAFEERRLDRLTAGALAHNDDSRAVLERVGFTREGRQRDRFFVEGERVDRVMYGLLRREWMG